MEQIKNICLLILLLFAFFNKLFYKAEKYLNFIITNLTWQKKEKIET